MTDPIRILLADDHPTLRAGVRAGLAAEPDLLVVDEVVHGDMVVPRCLELRPDVLLLDIEMPGASPLANIATLQAQLPRLKIVMLTAHSEAVYVHAFMAAGVAGYVCKDEPAAAIAAAVRTAAQGGVWLSRSIADMLTHTTAATQAVQLSERELAVLQLLVAGRSNKDIGLALGVSEKMIERRVSDICRQLGVTTRVAAAVKAVREGMV